MTSSDPTGRPAQTPWPRRSRLKWAWALALSGVGLLLFLAWLPSLLLGTTLGVGLLNQQLAKFGLQATAGRARGGWFEPLGFSQVVVGQIDQPPLFDAAELTHDQSLWDLLTGAPQNLGTITVRQPRLHFIATDQGTNFTLGAGTRPDQSSQPKPALDGQSRGTTQIDFAVEDAEVWLKTRTMPAEAALFRAVSVTGNLTRTTRGTELQLESGYLLREAKISPEICAGGLKFIVPVLSEVAWVQGEVSLELSECRVVLDDPQRSVIAGAVDVHQVSAGIRNELVQRIADIVNQILGRRGTGQVELISSRIGFHVREGRVWHEGLVFGLPEIATDLRIQSQGSVGFDETLDLEITIPMPRTMFRNQQIADIFSGQTLRLSVRGTLDKPEIEFDGHGLLASAVAELGQSFTDGEVKLQDLVESLRHLRENRDRPPFRLLPRNRVTRNDEQTPGQTEPSDPKILPQDATAGQPPNTIPGEADQRPARRLLRKLLDRAREEVKETQLP